MTTSEPIGVGVIGLGVMGRVHIASYAAADPVGPRARLVAVADFRPEQLTGRATAHGNIQRVDAAPLFDPTTIHTYGSGVDLLKDPGVELVSICTPTDTHADLAVAALEAGKHVLLEKPVATTLEEIDRVAQAAAGSGRLVMPAMCMRFWPGWTWLKDRIDDASLGGLTSISFTRMGAPPTWSPDFYLDSRRSGGALFDLHIHDADFIHYCFGAPESVSSQGSVNHLTTVYRYPSGRAPLRIVAESGWGAEQGFPFRMRYTALFEHATADFELGRDSPLLLTREGRCEAVPIPTEGAYQAEVRHMLEAVAAFRAGGHVKLRATIRDAQAVTRLLHAELLSLETGQPQPVK